MLVIVGGVGGVAAYYYFSSEKDKSKPGDNWGTLDGLKNWLAGKTGIGHDDSKPSSHGAIGTYANKEDLWKYATSRAAQYDTKMGPMNNADKNWGWYFATTSLARKFKNNLEQEENALWKQYEDKKLTADG